MRSSHACTGSPTTQGPPTTRDNAASGIAFRAYDRSVPRTTVYGHLNDASEGKRPTIHRNR